MNIPIELIIYVFGHLSPPDVLSLAATCRKHYNAWQQHTNTIYNLLSHTIQCEHDARMLLADQGILPVDSAMTAAGFLQLCQNAHVIEKIVDRFGCEIILPFCCPLGMSVFYWSDFFFFFISLIQGTSWSGGLWVLWWRAPATTLDTHWAPSFHPHCL